MAQLQPNRQGRPEAIRDLTFDLANLLATCGDTVDALDDYIADAKSANDPNLEQAFQQLRNAEAKHCEMVRQLIENQVKTNKF